jgi:methylated-DNA-protein-cysteine methyltransferase related protein
MVSTRRESSADERIWEVVRAIPRGKVATYGQIARLAGMLYGHRVAARALKLCPKELPWQRVLGKKEPVARKSA